jgi:hypothetical protein
VPDHGQRRLDRDGIRRDAEGAVERPEGLVDLPPALRLVDHPPHLPADEVRRDQDPAGPSHVEDAGQHVVVAGQEIESLDRLAVLRARLLHGDHVRDLRQLAQQVVRHVHRGPRGNVVEDDRQVARLRRGAEVLDHAAAVGPVVVGRHDQRGVDPDTRGPLGELDGVPGVVRARARDHRRAAALRDPDLPEGGLLVVGQRGALAGRPREHEAVRPVLEEMPDELRRRVLGERAVRSERRDHRREDAAEAHYVSPGA